MGKLQEGRKERSANNASSMPNNRKIRQHKRDSKLRRSHAVELYFRE
jgi:hypothetical protein